MAASLPPTQRREDFKEEFLSCSICTEPYDNDQHQAKCLPCLHTYCKSCLQQLAGRRPKINCPNCRGLVTLPGGTVNGLPSNFIVENLKDYHDIFNFAVTCGSCEDEGSQAVSFCHDCGCFICQTCMDAHRRMGPLRGHIFSTMTELQEKKCNPKAQQYQQCKKHPKQDLTLFCRQPNCKIPVCSSCGHVDHRGNDLIDLAAAFDEIVADMQRSIGNVGVKNQELTKKCALNETLQKKLTKNFNEKEKNMKQSKDNLINLINSRYTKAHSNLENLYQTEINQLAAGKESIDSLKAQMTSACEFANQACDTTNPIQLLTSQNQIVKRLSELQNKELPQFISEKDLTLDLTDKHQSAEAQIQGLVQDLFDNVWLKKPQKEVPQFTQEYGHQRDVFSSRKSVQASAPTIQPVIDPNKCTLQLKQISIRRLHSHCRRATVQAVDTTGKKMTTGGDKVEATQDGIGSHKVTDNTDGTYQFEYNKHVGQIHVKINGTPLKGSPFKATTLFM